MKTLISSILMMVMITLSSMTSSAYAADSSKLELVMVEEEGCVWCEQWLREIGPIYPKSDEGKIAPLRRIDISDPLPDDVQVTRGLHYTPTFVLLKDGKEKGRIEGYPGEDFFWGLLAQILASVDKKQASSAN